MNEEIIYIVGSDIETSSFYAEFDNEVKAIDFAKKNLDKLPFVQKVVTEYDELGNENFTDYIDIWDHTMVADTDIISEEDAWEAMTAAYEEEKKNKYDLGNTTWFESVDTNDLVEAMEENENMVECKECFELFPKTDCIKLDFGYICPTCADAGKLIVVSDEDTFKVEFPEYEKFQDTTDIFSEKESVSVEGPTEPLGEPGLTPEEAIPFLVKDEEEAIAGYEKATAVIEASDVENKEEILDTLNHIKKEEEEHIEELTNLVTDESIEVENDSISDVDNKADDNLVEAVSDDVIYTKDDGSYLIHKNTGNYIAFNKYNVYIGGIKADSNEEAIAEFTKKEPKYESLDEGTLKEFFSLGKNTNESILKGFYDDELIDAISRQLSSDASGVRADTRRYMSRFDNADDLADYLYYDLKRRYGIQYLDFIKIVRQEYKRMKESLKESETNLVEHVNEEHPAIESDQKLQGIDNAVVKCKIAKVITHSEDEKPLNCEMKDKPLEKPLTESSETDIVKQAAWCMWNLADFYEAFFKDYTDIKTKKLGKAAAKKVKDKFNLDGTALSEVVLKGYTLWKNLKPTTEDFSKKLNKDTESRMTLSDQNSKLSEAIDYNFTEEEIAEHNMDEDGISLDSYDEYVRCNWCGEVFAKSDCEFEANLGWLCDRCCDAITSRGEKLTIIKNPTDEDITKTLTEEVKMTAKELKDKFGTDDVDLINAGRESEERVELTEDADEIELTSDSAETPAKQIRVANTSSTSGMDFEEACKLFGIKLED